MLQQKERTAREYKQLIIKLLKSRIVITAKGVGRNDICVNEVNSIIHDLNRIHNKDEILNYFKKKHYLLHKYIPKPHRQTFNNIKTKTAMNYIQINKKLSTDSHVVYNIILIYKQQIRQSRAYPRQNAEMGIKRFIEYNYDFFWRWCWIQLENVVSTKYIGRMESVVDYIFENIDKVSFEDICLKVSDSLKVVPDMVKELESQGLEHTSKEVQSMLEYLKKMLNNSVIVNEVIHKEYATR